MNFEDMSEASQSGRSAGRDRIVEILVFLLDEMRQNKQLGEIDLDPLSQRGFTQTEISTAFSWLFDKIAIAGPDGTSIFSTTTPNSRNSFRVLHDVERSVLSLGAQGYLIQMRELGLIDDNDVEIVIDRILFSGVPSVNTIDVKELVGGLIFDFDDSSRPGSRLMLNATDTIQ